MRKIYLAASFGTEGSDRRKEVVKALDYLRTKFEVYAPWELHIPNAWDYPNSEWGQMVFISDMNAIQNCDIVVSLNYGRHETGGGTCFECGAAYMIGKPIILVEMTDNQMSLMIANGRWATVKGIEGLMNYDFDTMPKSRTDTEVD